MKKIALVEPRGSRDHVYSSVRMPRLGLPLLGTILHRAGHTVSLHVGPGGSLPWPKIMDCDLVGISTTTATSGEAYRIAGFLRSHRIPVVIGGIHATFYPEEALGFADFVVRGEADFSFPALVRSLDEGQPPRELPGVSYREGENFIHNPLPRCPVDLDDLPAPDFSLFGPRLPFRSIPVMTSRGCPYNCTFCCVTAMFGHRYRYRSAAKILEELSRYRGRPVFFCDDNFTADARRSKELLRGMLENGIKLGGWGAQVRVEAARDDELLDLMRRTGCRILYVGLESITPATLEAYNKHQTVEDIRNFVERCHDHRMRVHGMFIFGGDGDTPQTMRQTAKFALESRIDSVQFMTLTPLPGTLLFERLNAEKRILTYNWDLYDGHHVVFQPSGMTAQELQEGAVEAFRQFYSLRNLFQNARFTGWGTALYRGIGWWLVRRFVKHNRWYQRALAVLESSASHRVPLLYRRVPLLSKSKAALLSRQTTCSPLRIYITEGKGVLYLRLKGLLNRPSLKELHRTLAELLPGRAYHVVINARGLSFDSERAVQSFSAFLERLGLKVHRLQVETRSEHGLPRFRGRFSRRLPRFEIILDR